MLSDQPRSAPPRRAMLPQRWLMADAHCGNALPAMLAAMPPRSGVILRPYAMARWGRTDNLRRLARIARARRHRIIVAGVQAARFGDGWHIGGPLSARSARIIGQRLRSHGKQAAGTVRAQTVTMAVHNRRDATMARQLRADVALISPLLPTRSHPGASALGARRAAMLANACAPVAAIALGGMDQGEWRRLRLMAPASGHGGFIGWAGITAWAAPRAMPIRAAR